MEIDEQARDVLGQYPAPRTPGDPAPARAASSLAVPSLPTRRSLPSWDGIESRGNRGGLSGSRIWRIRRASGAHEESDDFCLRRWPAGGLTRARLAWIHGRLMLAASGAGEDAPLSFVAVPMLAIGGHSLVERHGHLWELTRWLPGTADFRAHPTEARLRAAGAAVARLHRRLWHVEDAQFAVAPGIQRRWQGVHSEAWSDKDLLRWRDAALRDVDTERGRTLESIVEELPEWRRACLAELASARRQQVPLQAALRDLWHAHLLFEQDELTGIVDYGAMQVDSVVADLTRWLGSCVGAEPKGWSVGLEAYVADRSLSREEMAILPAFEMGTTLLSAVQWLRWTYDECRAFEDATLARERQREILQRLRQGPLAVRDALRAWRRF